MANKNAVSELKTMRWPHELLRKIELVKGEQDFSSWVKELCEREAANELKKMVTLDKTKTCNACGKTKPASEFSTDNNKPGWLSAKCKPCLRDYQRERYQLKKANK